jgi:hypothetical protein
MQPQQFPLNVDKWSVTSRAPPPFAVHCEWQERVMGARRSSGVSELDMTTIYEPLRPPPERH